MFFEELLIVLLNLISHVGDTHQPPFTKGASSPPQLQKAPDQKNPSKTI
jgi:hypothetical protein